MKNREQLCVEDANLKRSQRLLLIQGALAAVLYSLGTGNFLAGYLIILGASPSLIAKIVAIPQLGCVLQLIAPLYFERKQKRKRAIVVMCFLFRFSIGGTVLAPLLFQTQNGRLGFVFVLYLISFMSAGFVTPALNQWIMQIAPTENRGQYFAIKDILAAVANAGVAFLMGRQLDVCAEKGIPMTGYFTIYGFCMLVAVVDSVLLIFQEEIPCPVLPNISPRDLLQPLKDLSYRPLLVYEILGITSAMLANGYLAVYQLNVLGLSHTFIASVGAFSSAITMMAIWFWGKVADKTNWTTVVLITRAMNVICLFGWCLMPSSIAIVGAPVLMMVSAAGIGASGMAVVNLQYAHCPEKGKTTYLGVTTAIGSLTGYAAAMLGSRLQITMEPVIGSGPSMAVLFGISGVLSLIAFEHGSKNLPRT